MSKPAIPQGTRDFSPEEVRKRQYILGTLKTIFEQYGFQPLETPAMENLVTLTGKYGEEGDRLIFKILNNGLHEKKGEKREKLEEEWNKMLSKSYSTPIVTERALRYDLTIPFARFVVMRQNDIAFPFRRYQMQPVWRADSPQRGRYREFWQCDCDVVGSTSLINEAELLCIYREAFHQLQLPQVVVKINSRKILAGIAEYANAADKLIDITVAIDKLDKIGKDGVRNELFERGLTENQVNDVVYLAFLMDKYMMGKFDDNLEIYHVQTNPLDLLYSQFQERGIDIGKAGINELKETIKYHDLLASKDWDSKLQIDFTLARGLNYYTGVIVEVATNAVKMGSIGGGGRYDDLTGLFGLKNMSGVGVSFGIDRIYDVLDELNLFPEALASSTKVMLLNFGAENEAYALTALVQLRNAGIAAEIYPDAAKFDKQMKYANKRAINYVIIPGDDERAANKLSLKNFVTGDQQLLSIEEVISLLK